MPGKTDANLPHESLTQEGSVPFFARFLEGQHSDPSQAANDHESNQNRLLQTLKYPSDRDEDDFR